MDWFTSCYLVYHLTNSFINEMIRNIDCIWFIKWFDQLIWKASNFLSSGDDEDKFQVTQLRQYYANDDTRNIINPRFHYRSSDQTIVLVMDQMYLVVPVCNIWYFWLRYLEIYKNAQLSMYWYTKTLWCNRTKMTMKMMKMMTKMKKMNTRINCWSWKSACQVKIIQLITSKTSWRIWSTWTRII